MKMYLPPKGASKSRRSFLRRGLVGTALLALGGGGWLITRKSASVEVPTGLQVLNASELAVVSFLVQRFLPPHAGYPSHDTLKTALAVDSVLARTEPSAQAELKQLLGLFENALPTFLFTGKPQPFTQLSPAEQEEVLSDWRDSRISLRRTGYLALRDVVFAAYFGQAQTWAAVGYDGPPKGLHDPNAPVWKGGDTPRPLGNGTFLDEPEAPTPEREPTP